VEGSVYWEYVYGSFASMQTYEPGAQPVVIDFEDDFEDGTDYYTERSDIGAGDDMTHMLSPRSQLSLVEVVIPPPTVSESEEEEGTSMLNDAVPESGVEEITANSMTPEDEVDECRPSDDLISTPSGSDVDVKPQQQQHKKILPLDTGFARSSFLELQKRLEQKSVNKKPPTFIPPASDKTLRTQFFGNHRVVTPTLASINHTTNTIK